MTRRRVALITGANRGIGLAIARRLGERGDTVWIASRSADSGEPAAQELRAAGADARFVALDVTSDESVRAAAEHVAASVDALDVLVNNAGMNFGPPGRPSDEDLEEIRAMFETNAFGPVRVTQAFLPLLRKSEAPRVIMATSGLGSLAKTIDMTSENWNVAFAGYAASKTALNMFALKFAKELLPDGIKVNVVDPGLTKTDLGGPLATRATEEGAAAALALIETDHHFGPTGGFYAMDQSGALVRERW